MGRLVRCGVGRCIRRLAREERGNALTIFAVIAPLFILFLALALDVGNWYAHKRQLQNRADAGALAAGVGYQKQWAACLTGGAGTTVANGITQSSRDYSGTVYNAGNPQGTVAVRINSTDYSAADFSDGGDPCYKHAADPNDWISPNGGHWTDVKVKESNIPTLFGAFGISLPGITARARVQVYPAESDHRFIPLGIPTPEIDHAEARFYNLCDRNAPVQIGLPTYLAPLADNAQSIAGTQLWGPSSGATSNAKWTTNSTDSALQLQFPPKTTCAGGTQDYVPIGVEVRIAGKTSPGIDLDAFDCPTLKTMRYADCFTDLTEIRAWNDDTPASPNPPTFKAVHLSNASCNPDAYFSRTASCPIQSGSLDVAWGANRQGPTLSHASYSITLNGASLTGPPAPTPDGLYTGAGGTTAANGAKSIVVNWAWTDGNAADKIPGGANCPCAGSGTMIVQRTLTATDTNAGPVQLVQVRSTNVIGANAALFEGYKADNQAHTVYLTVGLLPPFKAQGPLVTLRAGQSTDSQSLDCNNDNNGASVKDQFANGCKPFYTANDFSAGTWWPCPKPSAFPATNTMSNPDSNNPYRCVPVVNGLTPSTIADGMNVRTGNCKTIGPQQQCTKTQCNYPNGYSNYIDPTKTDPSSTHRIVKLFVMPYGAFKNVNVGQESLPVLDFAAFYVTGWGGQGNSNDDPCGGDDFTKADGTPVQAGEVVGHFVEFAGPDEAPVDETAQCIVGQIRPCEAVLVR